MAEGGEVQYIISRVLTILSLRHVCVCLSFCHTLLSSSHILQVERDDDLSSAPNPFAHGQLINHGTASATPHTLSIPHTISSVLVLVPRYVAGGDAANVMYYEVVFPPDFPSSLRLLIPSLHYQSAQPYLRTVCLVATRDVKDEEVHG